MIATQLASFRHRLGAFALVCVELALVLLVVHTFDIEAQKHFFPVLCLAVGGFVVHAWLPRRFRTGFFCLLSLTGILFVLGWPSGAFVIGIGGALIGLCHLPIPLGLRVLLLGVAAVQLAALRVQFPEPFWPVLGSMFMFRLIVYLYDLGHERGRPALAHTLAYFFPLPNVCFTLFPVLDFKTFRATYYDEDDYGIYQTGIAWMVRGISHLLAYRFVKYYLVPAPYEVRDGLHLALFLATNYALYLRVSGWFHLITGLLHLFGFDLPRTHHNYFLASSFSDIWRRINIYWKDFMTKIFFFPTFFLLRPWGTRAALFTATLAVFLGTWLLHTYQMFWLTGDLPVLRSDAVLWLCFGVLAAGNMQLELNRVESRDAGESAKSPQPRRARLWQAVTLSLRIVIMFWLVSFFWACWSIPDFTSYIRVQAIVKGDSLHGLAGSAAIIALAVAIGVLVQWTGAWLSRRGIRLGIPASFRWSVAVHGLALAILSLAALPQVAGVFGENAAEVVATMRLDSYTPLEAQNIVRGYYEEIAETPVQAAPWLGVLRGKDWPKGPGDALYTEMTRPADDLLERELIPGWNGTIAGSQLTINHLGLRDREGITQHKPAGVCRIALVGSSVVMGYGVADTQVFSRLLEDRLNAAAPPGGPVYEVLNFGTGMSHAIHRRVLIERRVIAFEPDALYYFAHQDEFAGPAKHLARLVTRGNQLPFPCLEQIVRKADVTPATPPGAADGRLLPFGREIVRCVYPGLVEDCRRRGILPVWVYLPMPGVVDVSIKSAHLISVAAEAGFVVVNLAKWADGHAPEEVKLSATDHHANALGHRLIAERLFEQMRERPELLPAWAHVKR
jgi:hypothetical protein